MSRVFLNPKEGFVWGKSPELRDAHLYSASPFVNVPGATNFFAVPIQCYFGLKTFLQAQRTKDRETKYDAIVKTVGAPFNLINAAGQLADYGTKAKVYKTTKFLKVFANVTAIFGLVVCAIEMALTARDLKRNNALLKLVRKPGTLEEKLTRVFKRYFQVKAEHPEQLLAKKVCLAKRVRKWLVSEIDNNLPRILADLKSDDPVKKAKAMHDGQLILDHLLIQTDKHLLFNLVAMASLIITVAGLSLLLAKGAKASTPIVLAGFAVGAVGFVLHKSLMDCVGVKFKWKKTFPESLRKSVFLIGQVAKRGFATLTRQPKPLKQVWKKDKAPALPWATQTEKLLPAQSPLLQPSEDHPLPLPQPPESCTLQAKKPVDAAPQEKLSRSQDKVQSLASLAKQAHALAQTSAQYVRPHQCKPPRREQKSRAHFLHRQIEDPSASQEPSTKVPFRGVVDVLFLAQIRRDLDHLQALISHFRTHREH